MTEWYLLKNRKPVPFGCDVFTDPDRFGKLSAKLFRDPRRQIRNTFIGNIRISTVFLGLNHCYLENSDPVLFETMVFGGPNDGDMERCCTHRQALNQHWQLVKENKH